jgi:hypothetical protein
MASNWITCGDPNVLRGVYPKPFPHLRRRERFALLAFESKLFTLSVILLTPLRWRGEWGEANGLPAVIQTFFEGFTQSPSRTFGAGSVLHYSLSKASCSLYQSFY